MTNTELYKEYKTSWTKNVIEQTSVIVCSLLAIGT